jgi:hypothetical protein
MLEGRPRKLLLDANRNGFFYYSIALTASCCWPSRSSNRLRGLLTSGRMAARF